MLNDRRTLPAVDRPPLSARFNTPDMTVPVVALPMLLPRSYQDAPLGSRPPAVWPRQYTPHPMTRGR